MTGLQKLLLLPCLSPLLAVLIVAGLNLNKPVNLRLLTWRSPTWTLGGWMAIGSSAGALFALAAGISLPQHQESLRRHVHQRVREASPSSDMPPRQDWEAAKNESNQPRRSHQESPERDLRDPSPTVAVPFRVIRKSSIKPPPHYEADPYPQPVEPYSERSSPSKEDDGSWGDPIKEDW